jgi:probable O-glycosylation ligase (exosortase A-associated)
MKPDLTLDWWRPDARALPVARQRAIVKLPGRFAFAAIAAYTIVLVAAPQEFVEPLRPLRLALVFALLGVMAHISDRALERVPHPPASREVRLVGALLAWAIVTMPLSYWPGGSFAALLDVYLKSVAVFVLLGAVVNTRARIIVLFWILSGCVLIVALTALRHYATGVYLPGAPGRIAGYGETGMAGNPNDLALLCCIVLPLMMALVRVTKSLLLRGAALAMALTSVAAVIATFSRGGFIALLSLAVLLVWRARRQTRLAILAGVVVVAGLTAVLAPEGYGDRLATVFNTESDSTGSAQDRWRDMVAATRYVASHPLVGAGLAMDYLALNEMRGQAWVMVHNAYLSHAVDLGLPGLALYVALLVSAIVGVGRVARASRERADGGALASLAGSVLVSLITFAIAASFYPIAYHPFFYYLAGLGVALQRIHALEEGTSA